MNRIAAAMPGFGLTPPAATEHSRDIATLAPRGVVPLGAPHAIFVPMHYEPGYAYPLVVWLHGAAGNERQMRRVMPLVSMRNYVAISPRAASPSLRHRSAFEWRQTSDDIEQAGARIFDCVALAKRRFNIHHRRIFLAGYSSGGTMALRVAWNHPDCFAGVASIGGPLPIDGCPLSRVNEMRQLPCLLATTRESCNYPERSVCRDLRLLHAAGCTVALRQYPGDDDLTTAMLADLDRWMMQLVCDTKR